jgi:isocitrate dehydrogenase kinase/phosphatase
MIPAPRPTTGAPGRAAPVEALAGEVADGFERYRQAFSAITRRARTRFQTRDWAEAQEDARERILLYDVAIHETLQPLGRRLDGHTLTPSEARLARESFAGWARARPDCEIAETFYNSVVRRLLGTVGVDEATEFVGDGVDSPAPGGARPWREHELDGGIDRALGRVLDDTAFSAPWHQRGERIRRAAALLRTELGPDADARGARLQVLDVPFFRNKAAYVVGRLVLAGRPPAPILLALTHPAEGIVLDAVLPTADEASVVFGFTRSYLHADIGAPRPVIEFLQSIMPHRRVDELYTAIGFNRHGKTEFYRSLHRYLQQPQARFEPAPGQAGLVMSVFVLNGLNVVFKVIRDRFGAPKRTSRERVMRNYGVVFVRDRVGRLADAQAFERMRLPLSRFEPAVLDELLGTAARTVSVTGGTVTIEHLYTERRVRPLDLYLGEVPLDEARRVTLEFGQAIKDLAAADIFPGDMLVKNFGVTRHGRVIFYDYDEVAPLASCNFRDPPPAAFPEAELADEPPYYVGPDDVFPSEWHAFLGPPGPLRAELHAAHPELFRAAWWRGMQERQKAGELVDFYPYDPERRLG